MAKKRSSSKSVKNKSIKIHLGKIKSLITFKNITIFMLLAIVSFQIYKIAMDKYNVYLLDKAEAKLRQVEFPAGGKPIIERYCSERSVKYGSPGRPTCGVSISAIFSNSDTINNSNSRFIDESLDSLGVNKSVTHTEEDVVYADLYGLVDGLICYSSDYIQVDYKSETKYQGIKIHCQKKFESKQYPIRD